MWADYPGHQGLANGEQPSSTAAVPGLPPSGVLAAVAAQQEGKLEQQDLSNMGQAWTTLRPSQDLPAGPAW